MLRKMFLFLFCLVIGSMLVVPAMAVKPTGLYPDDVINVQAAVDAGGTVVLEAKNAAEEPTVFNFGPATATENVRVTISRPMTVMGEPGSKIIGGNMPIVCNSPGVTIQNLTLEAYAYCGIASLNAGPGDKIIIRNNSLSSTQGGVVSYGVIPVKGIFLGFGILSEGNQCPIDILGNTIEQNGAACYSFSNHAPLNFFGNTIKAPGGIITEANAKHIQIGSVSAPNTIKAWYEGVWVITGSDDPDATISIQNNTINLVQPPADQLGFDAICLNGNRSTDYPCPGKSTGQCDNWPQMPQILVEENIIHASQDLNSENILASESIVIGRSANVCNNAIVRRNIIDGTAADGIGVYPYANNNLIEENDLRNLTTNYCSLFVVGRDNIFTKNKLGPSLWYPSVTVLWENIHIDNWAEVGLSMPTPDPAPVKNNVFIDNDYTATGKPGLFGLEFDWDALADFNILFVAVNGNHVLENKWPEGTTMCDQIWEMACNNSIHGISHCKQPNYDQAGLAAKIAQVIQNRLKRGR